MIDPKQVAAIEALEPPVVKAMRTILMAARDKADRGEFVVLKPWVAAAKRKFIGVQEELGARVQIT